MMRILTSLSVLGHFFTQARLGILEWMKLAGTTYDGDDTQKETCRRQMLTVFSVKL